jgi:hypothetical protein
VRPQAAAPHRIAARQALFSGLSWAPRNDSCVARRGKIVGKVVKSATDRDGPTTPIGEGESTTTDGWQHSIDESTDDDRL